MYSIELKFCLNTNKEILKELIMCNLCNKVPLPSFRIHNDIGKVYCESCYFSLNLDPNSIIYPSNHELSLLKMLLINCKNFEIGCNEIFKLSSLNEMVTHLEFCQNKFQIVAKKCKRCFMILMKDRYHDCFRDFGNKLSSHLNIDRENYNQLEKLVKDNTFMKMKICELESITSNQKKDILELKEFVRNLSKENIPVNKDTTFNNNIKCFPMFPKQLSINDQKAINIDNKDLNKDTTFNNNTKSFPMFPKQLSLNDQKAINIDNKDLNKDTTFNNNTKSFQMFPNQLSLNDQKAINIDKKVSQNEKINDNKCINLVEHEEAVHTITEIDNITLASGSDDKTVKIWNLKTNSCIKTLYGHTSKITALFYFSQTSVLVSGSSDKTIKIWNKENYSCLNTLKSHEGSVSSIISLNDSQLASGSYDKTIKVWDLKTSSCIQTFKGNGMNIVQSIVKLHRQNLIASGSSDSTIKIWDVREKKYVKSFEGHRGTVHSVISINDRNFASASGDGCIKLWDLDNNNCDTSIKASEGIIYSITEIDIGFIASGSSDLTIKKWDLKTSKCLDTLSGHRDYIDCVIKLSDKRLASASADKTIKLWR